MNIKLSWKLYKNPKDIEAICQLATVYLELRYDENTSIKLILDTLTNFADEISAIDKSRIYINLAFLYESNDEEKLLILFRRSNKIKSSYSGAAYNELGRIRMENNIIEDNLNLFEKAYSLSSKMKISI